MNSILAWFTTGAGLAIIGSAFLSGYNNAQTQAKLNQILSQCQCASQGVGNLPRRTLQSVRYAQ